MIFHLIFQNGANVEMKASSSQISGLTGVASSICFALGSSKDPSGDPIVDQRLYQTPIQNSKIQGIAQEPSMVKDSNIYVYVSRGHRHTKNSNNNVVLTTDIVVQIHP